jgi:hypothetical protein
MHAGRLKIFVIGRAHKHASLKVCVLLFEQQMDAGVRWSVTLLRSVTAVTIATVARHIDESRR